MRKITALIFVFVTPLLALGCQTVSVSSQPVNKTGVPLPPDRAATDEESVASDPCAIRIDHIVETIYQYYLLNKRLPLSLDELRPYQDMLTPLAFTCTASGQPYQYNSYGLMAAGHTKKIILWDPTPAHQGGRYCILTPDIQSGGALQLEVAKLSESDFKNYVPGIQ